MNLTLQNTKDVELRIQDQRDYKNNVTAGRHTAQSKCRISPYQAVQGQDDAGHSGNHKRERYGGASIRMPITSNGIPERILSLFSIMKIAFIFNR